MRLLIFIGREMPPNFASSVVVDDDEIFCGMVDQRKAGFPAGAIVRDLHHCKSLTCCKQDLNLHVPLEISKNHRFSDNSRGNISYFNLLKFA